jgi:flavin reductase (DIM6/NTAB) family NADH-FMN oxidoreductase RutF
MTKRLITPHRPACPSPPALITSVDADGRPNIITLAETYNLSIRNPVIIGIGIAKQRYSHQLITQCREFVVNLPTAALVEKVDRCGTTSGRTVDKFAAFGLTPLPSTVVRPPLIAECPVNIECRLLDIIETGDHDLFMGEAVAEHVDEEALGPDGKVSLEKLDLLGFAYGRYFSIGQILGAHSYTSRLKAETKAKPKTS